MSASRSPPLTHQLWGQHNTGSTLQTWQGAECATRGRPHSIAAAYLANHCCAHARLLVLGSNVLGLGGFHLKHQAQLFSKQGGVRAIRGILRAGRQGQVSRQTAVACRCARAGRSWSSQSRGFQSNQGGGEGEGARSQVACHSNRCHARCAQNILKCAHPLAVLLDTKQSQGKDACMEARARGSMQKGHLAVAAGWRALGQGGCAPTPCTASHPEPGNCYRRH